ncbi:MAG: hypothetical protein LBR28_00840 [Bacteroidales bacterium]|nr:hypothetical protein [Bacteroidales bacterium]
MIALTETMVAAVEIMVGKTKTKVAGFATMVDAIKTRVLVWIASLSLAMTRVIMVITRVETNKRCGVVFPQAVGIAVMKVKSFGLMVAAIGKMVGEVALNIIFVFLPPLK